MIGLKKGQKVKVRSFGDVVGTVYKVPRNVDDLLSGKRAIEVAFIQPGKVEPVIIEAHPLDVISLGSSGLTVKSLANGECLNSIIQARPLTFAEHTKQLLGAATESWKGTTPSPIPLTPADKLLVPLSASLREIVGCKESADGTQIPVSVLEMQGVMIRRVLVDIVRAMDVGGYKGYRELKYQKGEHPTLEVRRTAYEFLLERFAVLYAKHGTTLTCFSALVVPLYTQMVQAVSALDPEWVKMVKGERSYEAWAKRWLFLSYTIPEL